MTYPLIKGKSLLLLALLPALVPGLVRAESEQTEAPSPELLEFLGSWEADDGQWLDPLELLDEIEAEAKTANVEEGSANVEEGSDE
jgi:hypothetical protein